MSNLSNLSTPIKVTNLELNSEDYAKSTGFSENKGEIYKQRINGFRAEGALQKSAAETIVRVLHVR